MTNGASNPCHVSRLQMRVSVMHRACAPDGAAIGSIPNCTSFDKPGAVSIGSVV